MAGTKVAVAIGIGGADGLPALQGAINGAKLFHAWANAQGYTAHLVIDEDDDVSCPQLNQRLKSALNVAGGITRFALYFAGHGLIREAEQGLWLLSDWRDAGRVVSVEALRRRIAKYNVGQISIFSDACRTLPPTVDIADMTTDAVLDPPGGGQALAPQVDKFVAAQDGDAAYMIPGKTPKDHVCLFSGVLIEGLWGANPAVFSRRAPRTITSQSLGTYLRAEVRRRAQTTRANSIQP